MPCQHGHDHTLVRQVTSQTCGTACIEMVCRSLNARLDYSNFQETFYKLFVKLGASGTGAREKNEKGGDKIGLEYGHIQAILRGLGFSSQSVPTQAHDQAGARIRQDRFPIIAEVMPVNGVQTLHWVVIAARTPRFFSSDIFCILDPCQSDAISAPLPPEGLVTYRHANGRQLVFTGRVIHSIGRS